MSHKDNEKKASKFNPFGWMERDGVGVDDDEPPILDNPGIKNYFKLFGRRFNQIVSVNILMVVCNFPLIFAIAALSGYFSIHSTAPTHSIFAQINGAVTHAQNAFSSAIIGTYGAQSDITVLSQVDYVLLTLAFLVLFTFGPVMIGSTHIMRSMVRENHIFIWHDFRGAIKRNLKQGIIFGILDLVIMILIAYDVVFCNVNYSHSMMTVVMFFASLILAALYTIMRMYIYPMIITFDLPLGKIMKNALIFTVLGIKRNAVALLITLVISGINIFLFGVYFPIGIILPFVITFGILSYTGMYFAYPVISKYMIEPYYNKDGTPKNTAMSNTTASPAELETGNDCTTEE